MLAMHSNSLSRVGENGAYGSARQLNLSSIINFFLGGSSQGGDHGSGKGISEYPPGSILAMPK